MRIMITGNGDSNAKYKGSHFRRESYHRGPLIYHQSLHKKTLIDSLGKVYASTTGLRCLSIRCTPAADALRTDFDAHVSNSI